MANKLSDIGMFYKQIEDFKDKIVAIFSKLNHNKEIVGISKYYDKLQLARKVNVRAPIELLYAYGVCVYAEKILLRDEQFFIGQVDVIKNVKQVGDVELEQKDLLFIGQISGVWDQLSPAVKNNIWSYVQIICLLAEKVTNGNVLKEMKLKLQQTGRIV